VENLGVFEYVGWSSSNAVIVMGNVDGEDGFMNSW